jgi:predicted amidohydrolase YtcJ
MQSSLRIPLLALLTLSWLANTASAQAPPEYHPQFSGPDPALASPRAAATPVTDHGITIFTARKIVTMNPSMPEARAVAVRDGKIVAVGETLDQVMEWTEEVPYKIDQRFANDVMLAGFYESHMHPQLTGLLWQGVYVGRFDRVSPEGKTIPGAATKQEVLDRLAAQAKTMKNPGSWLIAWGYQPEFYGNSPLTRKDLDPISNGHPMLIENLSMHIFYTNSEGLEQVGLTGKVNVAGILADDNGEATGVLEEAKALEKFIPKLPKVDAQKMDMATWNAAKLANLAGVTTISDASFGTMAGSYEAYRRAAANPDYPVRLVLYPMYNVLMSPKLGAMGGLNLLPKLHDKDTDRLKIGGVKFITDGSLQGYTANLQYPYYYKSFKNGTVNMTLEQLEEGLLQVHRMGYQVIMHTNADQATENAIEAVAYVQDKYPRPDPRPRLEHNQMVTDSQLRRMAALGMLSNFLIQHVYYWGDLHYSTFLGPERALRLDPAGSALRLGVPFSLHSDSSVTPLNPLQEIWVAATRQTLSGRVLGAEQRISLQDALYAVTLGAAYLNFEEGIKGSVESGKLADFTVLSDSPLDVPADQIRDLEVRATVVGGKVFPVQAPQG